MRKKIGFATKAILNTNYLTSYNPTDVGTTQTKWDIFSNHSVLIRRTLEVGYFLGLGDQNLNMAPEFFWSRSRFETYCKYLLFTFNEDYFDTITLQLMKIPQNGLEFFLSTLENFPSIGKIKTWAFNEYDSFIVRKYNSLISLPEFQKAWRIDQVNRGKLIKALDNEIKRRLGQTNRIILANGEQFSVETPERLNQFTGGVNNGKDEKSFQQVQDPNQVIGSPQIKKRGYEFIDLLNPKPTKESTFQTIFRIIEQARLAFNPFDGKQIFQNDKRNKKGINGSLKAILLFLLDYNYLSDKYDFNEIRDALKTTTGIKLKRPQTFKSRSERASDFEKYYRKLEEAQAELKEVDTERISSNYD